MQLRFDGFVLFCKHYICSNARNRRILHFWKDPERQITLPHVVQLAANIVHTKNQNIEIVSGRGEFDFTRDMDITCIMLIQGSKMA